MSKNDTLNNINYEKELWHNGCIYVAGVDEVGRGPLAGPLVVCAVVLNPERVISGINDVLQVENTIYRQINDSKVLTDKKRRELADKIKNEAFYYSIQEISNIELDTIGISQATQKAFYNSVVQLLNKPTVHVLTDMFNIHQIPNAKQTNIVKGDRLSMTIGAASIVAKVYRDDLMIAFHDKYPVYGFDKHKGYGTKAHIEAINKYGPCEIHRRSFEPIKTMMISSNTCIDT